MSASSLRSELSRSAARSQLMAGSGWIVFHHFRRSAGTSLVAHLLAYLAAITNAQVRDTELHRHIWAVGGTHLYEQEWGAFPADHLGHEPPAVLVTSLRDPVERQISEFFHAGPGRDGDDRLAAWESWMDTPVPDDSAVVRGAYVDNFMVRSLIGRPDPVRVHDVVPYFGDYGVWGGGQPLWTAPLERAHLDLALLVINSFDIVVMAERMNDPRTSRALADYFGVPSPPVPHLKRSGRRPVPEVIRERLVTENLWDIELFEAANRYPSPVLHEVR